MASKSRTHAPRVRALALVIASILAPALGASGMKPGPEPLGDLVVTPQNCNDNGTGSLREAFAQPADQLTIDLSALACSTITLTSGALVVPADTRVVYLVRPPEIENGRPVPVLTIDGNGADRVIEDTSTSATRHVLYAIGIRIVNGKYVGPRGGCVYSSGFVGLSASEVSGCEVRATGEDTAAGGGIYAKQGVYLVSSTVRDNIASAPANYAYGGGVFSNEGIAINTSTISGNRAIDGYGGGIAMNGSMFIQHSTIASNTAAFDGGLAAFGGTADDELLIRNSTISGNSATIGAGGVEAWQALQLDGSTITGNTSGGDAAGGLSLNGSTAALRSTIVFGNTSNGGAADVGGNGVANGGRNLIGDASIPIPPDTWGQDPLLLPLADNGGFTMTHALAPGSPAIDRGGTGDTLDGLDQRFAELADDGHRLFFYERIVGPAADIGAFEFGAPDLVFRDGFELDTPKRR